MASDNPIFDLIVADGDNIEALAAYGLYKKHKRSWAGQIFDSTSKKPTQKENLEFAKAVSTPDQIQRYRKDAQDILIAFANQTVEDARLDISQDAIAGRIEAAAGRIEVQGKFWSMVGVGIVSTLINTAVLILLAIAIRLFGVDVIDAFMELSETAQNAVAAPIAGSDTGN